VVETPRYSEKTIQQPLLALDSGFSYRIILWRMIWLGERLRVKRFGLKEARALAEQLCDDTAAVKALVRELFGDDVEVRKRAADTARRISERDAKPLERYADEFAGLLESLPMEESRTRWHLGLVVPRVANTRMQRVRAARVMSLLAQDESNVVRCSAVEGLGTLALKEPSLRDEVEEMVERYLREGTTKAMKSRARAVRKMLRKNFGETHS
jgi:hypothetical protein